MIENDEQLRLILQGCKHGHSSSQEALYRAYYALCMGICMRYSKNKDDAMEVLQDGYVKVFEHIKDFRMPEKPGILLPSFVSWIKKIMVYTAIDSYRSGIKRIQTRSMEDSEYRIAGTASNALDRMAYDELIGIIQRLSPGYRSVFNLHVLDGFSHEEIADMLGISVGTSKSNLSKARENLRKLLIGKHERVQVKYD